MPGMTEANNVPWWAPGRPLIVSDPQKLTYFARANAVRAGVQSMPGALQGVAPGDGEWADPFSPDSAPGDSRALASQAFFDNQSMMADNRVVPMSTADGSGSVNSSNVETNSGGSTLDYFFNKLNNFIRPAPTVSANAGILAPPSPWPWVVGIGAAGLLFLAMRKKRA